VAAELVVPSCCIAFCVVDNYMETDPAEAKERGAEALTLDFYFITESIPTFEKDSTY